MRTEEFKAWFDGFTESMDKPPTAKQWERIKKRVKEIDGSPVTERIFVDRYWPAWPSHPPYHYWRPWDSGPTWVSGVCTSELMANCVTPPPEYNSSIAMLALGRADAQSLSVT